ncbi:MAG: hypothetical protein FWB88_08535 [Defluviitaleaceae bacterium]|nr:hypothetical protein [Defluviitaleaceae bacterium]MCL2240724.1 hypothetical protein [Defluviitaleaceae bacterium]
MPITFIATCLTAAQGGICAEAGIPVMPCRPSGGASRPFYARSLGEITPGCVTDFSVHCFNSATLAVLAGLGVARATLHPELNLAQIRDMKKPIPTEAILYGKLPLMKLGNPLTSGKSPEATLTDRKNAQFFLHGDTVYNSVPLFMADKLQHVEKSGLTHGRLIFTTETAEEAKAVIKAYLHRKPLRIPFTRGKF